MNFELLVFLTIALSRSITAAPTGGTHNQSHYKHLLGEAFAADRTGRIICTYLSVDQLKKMAEIPDLSGCAIDELNHRSKIAFYQNGTMKPAYLRKAIEIISSMDFADFEVAKNFTLLPFLASALSHVITGTLAERTYNQTCMKYLLEKVLAPGPPGRSITKNLGIDQLKAMAEIPDFSGCANEELNRRTKIAFYQNGAMKPAYLGKINEILSSMNFTDLERFIRALRYYWAPCKAVMFGNKQSMRNINGATLLEVLMFVSYFDHLSIVGRESWDINNEFIFPTEMKENGSPMNGFIFPWTMRSGDFSIMNMGDLFSTVGVETCLKLAIVINNEGEEQETAKKGALATAEDIYRRSPDTLVCIVAQADKRPVKTNYEMGLNGRVLMFHGHDVQSSIRVLEKNDTEETLKAKFEDWKKELTFLDSYQTVAFHLTVVNADEPENGDDLFRETFRNTPLSTFRLLDNSSTVGVMNEVGLRDVPVYALVGFPKYG